MKQDNHAAHTLGPWHVAGPRFDITALDIDDTNGRHVAGVFRLHHSNPLPCDANGALIAAAPELLEALERYVNSTARFGSLSDVRDTARAVLAKARKED